MKKPKVAIVMVFVKLFFNKNAQKIMPGVNSE